MEPTTDAAAVAAASDASPPADVGAEPPIATDAAIDADLKEVWDRLHPVRDGTGRFAAREMVADEAEAPPTTEQAGEQPADQVAGSAPDAPLSWSAEMKEKWASLPPDVKSYIAQRDKEQHAAITRRGQEIKAFEPIDNVLAQYAETFRRNNVEAADGIARLLAVEQQLAVDPRGTLRQVAQAYGVDLRELASGQPPSTEGAELSNLRGEIAQLKSTVLAQQRFLQRAGETVRERQLATFAADKPHFETVRPIVESLLNSGSAATPEQAYDMAIHAHPEMRRRLLEDERRQDVDNARRRAADARRSAAVNVRSATGSGAKPKTIDDTLREIARKHYGT